MTIDVEFLLLFFKTLRGLDKVIIRWRTRPHTGVRVSHAGELSAVSLRHLAPGTPPQSGRTRPSKMADDGTPPLSSSRLILDGERALFSAAPSSTVQYTLEYHPCRFSEVRVGV